MQVYHFPVFDRKGKHCLQNLPVVRQKEGWLLHHLLKGYGMTAEKAFQQILAGIDRDPDEPGLLVLLIFKGNRTKDILQKNSLKYVLGIRMILQMYHAKPPNHVRILFNDPVYLLLVPHPETPFIRQFVILTARRLSCPDVLPG
jgi:hypothetical protein